MHHRPWEASEAAPGLKDRQEKSGGKGGAEMMKSRVGRRRHRQRSKSRISKWKPIQTKVESIFFF